MTTATSPTPAPAPRKSRRWILFTVLLAVVAVAIWFYVAGIGRESTDDAFVAADVYQVNTKVSGRLLEVLVKENQDVDAGQPLAVIEAADYQSRLEQQRAAVALAQAQLREAEVDVTLLEATTAHAVDQQRAAVTAAEASLQQQRANLAAVGVENDRASAEATRYQQLTERAVSRQRLQDVESRQTTAAATLQAAQQGLASAEADVAVAKARLGSTEAERARVDVARATVARRTAELQQAEAALHEAELQLSYTRIVAPAKGRVTRKLALPGTFVQPGQTLMAVVGRDVWAIANFKETQLEEMRPGQHATVHVDAYGIDLDGHVDSIQRGSGAAFSLLPPENATGNYVKVVQRVPVKIVFDRQPDPATFQLGPGMSVVPTVHTR